jgi:hypothetical protein
MRRSTVQRKAYSIYKEVVQDFEYRTIMEDGSPEGLIDAIKPDVDAYTIQSTELGGVLSRGKRPNSYSLGLFQMWSKLYYGEGGVQHLSARGNRDSVRILRPNLYVTMLAGLQTPELYFTEQMIQQGLMRRLFVVFVERAERYLPPINQMRAQLSTEDSLELLKDRREALQHLHTISVAYHPEAAAMINSVSQETSDLLDADCSKYNLYAQSKWEHLSKFATLEAINEEMLSDEVLVIQKRHVKAVKKYVDEVYMRIKPSIDNIGLARTSAPSRESDIDKILRIIRESGRGYIKRSELYGRLRWSRRDVEQILSTMIEAELIGAAEIYFSRRPTRVYYIWGEMPRELSEMQSAPL